MIKYQNGKLCSRFDFRLLRLPTTICGHQIHVISILCWNLKGPFIVSSFIQFSATWKGMVWPASDLVFLLSSLSSTSMAGDFLVNKNKTWGANSYFEQELLDYLRVTICDEIIKSFYHLATLFKLNRVDNPFLRFANLFYMFLRCADECVCFFSSIETSIP